MNIKAIIRDAIEEKVDISTFEVKEAIHAALEEMDIGEKTADAIAETLPVAIYDKVEEYVDEVIKEIIEETIEEEMDNW